MPSSAPALRSPAARGAGSVPNKSQALYFSQANTHAERIFSEPETLRELACDQALVRQKLVFVLQTYIKLHVRMTETFRDLDGDAQRQFAGCHSDFAVGSAVRVS
jgi:hypothetical protein